jgi:hypothetical protein
MATGIFFCVCAIISRAERLLRLIHKFTAEGMQDRVEFLSNWQA